MVNPANGDQNDFDITSAWDALDVPNKKKTGQRMADLEKSERQPIKKTDGRRLRRTGRSTQMNLKVKPHVRDKFLAIAKARGMSMGELLEVVLAEWQAPGGEEER